MMPGTAVLDESRQAGGDRPLTLVHVLAPAPFGGLESVVHALAAGQRAAGHRVHVLAVVTPAPGEHPFVAALRGEGIDAVQIELPGRAYLEERRRIAAFCRDVGADILHTHGYRPDVLHAGVARALGIPRVTTVHGFIGGTWRGRIYEWLQLRAFRGFDAVVAVARPQIRRLVDGGVPRERIHLLPNAFRPGALLTPEAARAELGVPASAFHIGWVGRLSREKGPDVLLEAVARLGELPVVVSIIGDGPERAELQAMAERLGIAGRIRWHGSVPAAGRLCSAFDAFVLSSRTEGTPIALLEAMAAAIPIVATTVGGVPDVVSVGEARLVPPEDPAAIAAAIRTIHADPAAARELGRAARRRLDAFAPGPWLQAYETIYRSLLPSATPTPRVTR
jgi:glycosyltransferase involved in cell wall biosynthesis